MESTVGWTSEITLGSNALVMRHPSDYNALNDWQSAAGFRVPIVMLLSLRAVV